MALAGTVAATTFRLPPGPVIPVPPSEAVLMGGIDWLVATRSRHRGSSPDTSWQVLLVFVFKDAERPSKGLFE